jgi:hypothetical protein
LSTADDIARHPALSLVSVETITSDNALRDRSDAALPRERPRAKPHHRLVYRNLVVRSKYSAGDIHVSTAEHPGIASRAQYIAWSEFGEHCTGDLVCEQPTRHVLMRCKDGRGTSIELEYPER